jgi:hypothetical protein
MNKKNNFIKHKNFIPLTLCLTGTLLSLLEAIHIVRFVNRLSSDKHVTVLQYVKGLIIPHIILLASLALTTTGIILLIRHSIIHKRMQHDKIS